MALNFPPTPIPLGSPYLKSPPMLDRKGVIADGKLPRDQRNYTRRDLDCNLWLIDSGAQSVVRCKTDDISDAGVFASAPVGYGLGVGQRYEVRIASAADFISSSPHQAPSLGYGTVIRLEVDLTKGESHRVGFAIRFDVPQLIPI
ncbi:MAG TPA: hypothetical protein VNT79_01885 [Phycisphaerae bacterium]|nr:hypothetical protein [Phycisphaerae bacterium]